MSDHCHAANSAPLILIFTLITTTVEAASVADAGREVLLKFLTTTIHLLDLLPVGRII